MNARAALNLVRDRPPLLGGTRLLCIDGPAGSGKSTLAAAIALIADAPVVRMDDLYPGWSGLFTVDTEVLGLLEPLSGGAAGSYRRYDWTTDRYAEQHTVQPAPLLILEGVGAGKRAWAHWASALVWVATDDETRLARGLARDGEAVRGQWLAWMRDEARLFAEEQTRDRADLVIGT